MTINALSGPVIVYQDGGILTNSSANQNPDQGPSLFINGVGVLDPRSAYTYFPGMPDSPVGFTSAGAVINAADVVGWLNAEIQLSDYAPGTASTTSLASSANISTATSVTLTTSNTYAITTNSSVTNATTGTNVTGLWRIDSTPAQVAYSQGVVSVWDPANPPIGRAVSFATTSNLSAVNVTITGYDAYGYPIVNTIALPNNGTVYSTKTFKWITSVVTSTTSSSTFSVGVGDIYGLPVYVPYLPYVTLYWNNALATASSTFTAGSTLTTAGAADVRGTMQMASASDGTKRMIAWAYISPANIATATGMFGVTPA
jgi:hypothetical protein